MRNLVLILIFLLGAGVTVVLIGAYSSPGEGIAGISPAYATFSVIPVAIFGVPALLLAVTRRLLRLALGLTLAIPVALLALFLFAARQ